MFGMYPKPLKYKSTKVQYLGDFLGRTLLAYMLNLKSKDDVLTYEEDETVRIIYSIYTDRLKDCGIGIALIQFTAAGRDGVSVSEAIRDGDYDMARVYSNWWERVTNDLGFEEMGN